LLKELLDELKEFELLDKLLLYELELLDKLVLDEELLDEEELE